MDVTMVTDVPQVTTSSAAEGTNSSLWRGLFAFVILLFGLLFHILAVLATRKAATFGTNNESKTVPYFLLGFLLKVDFIAVVFFLIRGLVSPLKSSLVFRCEFGVSTGIFFTTVSGLANVVMCMERCVALMAPFHYRKHVTLFRAKMGALVTVLAAFIFTLLPFMGVGAYSYETENEIGCVSPGDLHLDVDLILVHTTIFFIIGFSIVLILVVCNLIVVRYILRFRVKKIAPEGLSTTVPQIVTGMESGTQITTNFESGNEASIINKSGITRRHPETIAKPNERNTKRDIHLAALFIAVSIIYTISWLPLYVSKTFDNNLQPF